MDRVYAGHSLSAAFAGGPSALPNGSERVGRALSALNLAMRDEVNDSSKH